MISWIQHHLIRHGRWVFLTLLAVIIVAFVFTIGNTPGCTTDRSGYEENLFYGIDMNSPLERDAIVEKVSVNAFLNNQQFRSDEQFQNALTSRIAMLHLASVIGIPAPSQAVLAEYIQTKNAFRGPDGDFSADAYTRFVDQIESNPRTPKGMVITVLEEDYRIEQVAEALSGPGYLLPAEAQAQTQRNRTKLTLATAELSFAEFVPEIEPSQSDLTEYYEANKQRYEIPERIKASYILFPADTDASQAIEPTEAELREHFAADRAAFVADYKAANPQPNPAEGEEAPEEEPVTFEQVREAVLASYRDEQAFRAANEAAQAFAFQLYRDEISRESAAFNQLLNESGLSPKTIEPYTLSGAKQRALSPEMLESAFALGGNRYYSDAYEVDGGFAVLIYEGRIAPEIPPFESVSAVVRADYSADQKRRLFNEKGLELKEDLEAALAAEQDFIAAAEELGLEAQSFESFEVQAAPAELNRSALQRAQSMKVGEISPMLTLGGQGTFVYLIEKEVPELSTEDPDVTRTLGMLERWASFTTRSDLTSELVIRGLPEEAAAELD